jgi:hypothetical protein
VPLISAVLRKHIAYNTHSITSQYCYHHSYLAICGEPTVPPLKQHNHLWSRQAGCLSNIGPPLHVYPIYNQAPPLLSLFGGYLRDGLSVAVLTCICKLTQPWTDFSYQYLCTTTVNQILKFPFYLPPFPLFQAVTAAPFLFGAKQRPPIWLSFVSYLCFCGIIVLVSNRVEACR